MSIHGSDLVAEVSGELPPEVRVAFPPEVIAEAAAAAAEPELPARDETAVPFLTVALPGTRELDQATLI